MAKRRRRPAYETTNVSISRTREQIDDILKRWGVGGIQWQDDFDRGRVTLRFRWKNEDDGIRYVARYHMDFDDEEKLRKKAVDGRTGKFSEKKFERVQKERGKQEHRVLLNFLKNVFEAVDSGIIDAAQIFLPWLEDVEGVTVYERIGPVMKRLAASTLPNALGPAEDE